MIITITNKKIRINFEMRHKYVLFSSLISGILANLYMFTNKISFHDDIGSLFFSRCDLFIRKMVFGNIRENRKFTVWKL